MEIYKSEDTLVTKYLHDNGAETAIKSFNSCSNVINPLTGNIESKEINRNKYSVFISSSVGCYMKCKFCYLTTKKSEYHKLTKFEIVKNLKEAIEFEIKQNNPSLAKKYMKLCWMGMGDAINQLNIVEYVSLNILDWAFENYYAIGLDGVDLSTTLPKLNYNLDIINKLHKFNETLNKYPININNNQMPNNAYSNFKNYVDRSSFRLFYSLHSIEQQTRDILIPNALSITDAIELLKRYSNNNEYNLIFHYMFMEGVNDSEKDVDNLINFIHANDLNKYEFRILRYNKCKYSNLNETNHFMDILKRLSSNINYLKFQISSGTEIKAACGQFLVKHCNI